MSKLTKLIHIDKKTDDKIYNTPVVFAIGVFDGVHDGHKKLIAETINLAKTLNSEACIFTFWPHPTFIINPKNPKKLLLPYDEKINKLSNLDVDVIFEQHFDTNFSQKEPKDFLKYLCLRLNVKGICIGEDFRFGFNQTGDTEMLKALTQNLNITIKIIKNLTKNGQKISSTMLRNQKS